MLIDDGSALIQCSVIDVDDAVAVMADVEVTDDGFALFIRLLCC